MRATLKRFVGDVYTLRLPCNLFADVQEVITAGDHDGTFATEAVHQLAKRNHELFGKLEGKREQLRNATTAFENRKAAWLQEKEEILSGHRELKKQIDQFKAKSKEAKEASETPWYSELKKERDNLRAEVIFLEGELKGAREGMGWWESLALKYRATATYLNAKEAYDAERQGIQQESDQSEHRDRESSGQTAKTASGYSPVDSQASPQESRQVVGVGSVVGNVGGTRYYLPRTACGAALAADIKKSQDSFKGILSYPSVTSRFSNRKPLKPLTDFPPVPSAVFDVLGVSAKPVKPLLGNVPRYLAEYEITNPVVLYNFYDGKGNLTGSISPEEAAKRGLGYLVTREDWLTPRLLTRRSTAARLALSPSKRHEIYEGLTWLQ